MCDWIFLITSENYIKRQQHYIFFFVIKCIKFQKKVFKSIRFRSIIGRFLTNFEFKLARLKADCATANPRICVKTAIHTRGDVQNEKLKIAVGKITIFRLGWKRFFQKFGTTRVCARLTRTCDEDQKYQILFFPRYRAW